LICFQVSLIAFLTITGCGGSSGDAIDFEPYSEAAVREAQRSGRPLLIKATADW